MLGLALGSLSVASQGTGGLPKSAPSEHWRLDARRIDRTLNAMVSENRVVGASVLVWQGGKERYFRTAGFADRETGRPLARNTLLQIFSMTKPVTGISLMQLWEQGKFRLDGKVAQAGPSISTRLA